MSQENVEIVRGVWEAFLAGDLEPAIAGLDPNVVWDGTNLPDGRVARGLGEVLDHIVRWAAMWDDWTVEPERYLAAGPEQVVLIMRERGRSKSGMTMDERHAEIYTVQNGRIVHRVGYSDPANALEAAGLTE